MINTKVLMTRKRHLALEILRGERSVLLVRFDGAHLELGSVSLDKCDGEFDVPCSSQPGKLAEMFQRSLFPRSEFVTALLTRIAAEKGIKAMDVKKATMKELVDAYNAKAPKPVKRFADRKSAEKRVLAILNGEEPATPATAIATATAAPNAAESSAATERKTPEESTMATKKAPRMKKEKSTVARDRSKATAATWENKRVAKDRATKHRVKVDGTEYRSVLEAFQKLKLQISKHITFRKELKGSESGIKMFEGRRFTLVPYSKE